MSGRYRLSRSKQLVEEYCDTDPGEQDWSPRYNIAPTRDVPIIRQDPQLRARSRRSACTEIPQVPASGGGVLRVAEGLEIEAALLFRSQRVLGVRNRRNLGSLDNARGNAVETCSILTTTPNVETAAVRDGMPVILDFDSYDLWLDPGLRNVDFISELLKPTVLGWCGLIP